MSKYIKVLQNLIKLHNRTSSMKDKPPLILEQSTPKNISFIGVTLSIVANSVVIIRKTHYSHEEAAEHMCIEIMAIGIGTVITGYIDMPHEELGTAGNAALLGVYQ